MRWNCRSTEGGTRLDDDGTGKVRNEEQSEKENIIGGVRVRERMDKYVEELK